MTTHAHVSDVTTAEFLAAVVDRSRQVPVLVDFWATWCGPCRAFGPILERLAGEYAGGFELAKVDTDREQALAAQFQIRSIPTVMLFKDGKPVSGFPGALPEGQIRRFLSQHGVEPAGPAAPMLLSEDPSTRVDQLRALVASAPDRESYRLELAVALVEAGDTEARQALEALPAGVYGDARAVRARARLALRELAAAAETNAAVREGIETLLAGGQEAGLARLLDALREDKDEQSPARHALVAALQSLDDDALVRDGRRRMAAVLF